MVTFRSSSFRSVLIWILAEFSWPCSSFSSVCSALHGALLVYCMRLRGVYAVSAFGIGHSRRPCERVAGGLRAGSDRIGRSGHLSLWGSGGFRSKKSKNT